MLMPYVYCGSPENNDQWIHRIVFPNKRTGFFIEIGAAEGVYGSSCCFLEQIGWRGICVEPLPSFFVKLKKNRRKAICENACVTNRTGSVRFRPRGYLSQVDYSHEFDRRAHWTPSITLADLLKKHHGPKLIDFLAMDCEGSERAILSVFPFDEYQILAIAMESDEAADILAKNGFRRTSNPFNKRSPWERYYLHGTVTCPAYLDASSALL